MGAGSWGTTFAQVLCDAGTPTMLWARDPAIADAVNSAHENPRYLPGIALPAALAAQAEYERRVVSRGLGSGSWAPFYQAGLHENAARDRGWTAAEFRPFLANAGLRAGPPG